MATDSVKKMLDKKRRTRRLYEESGGDLNSQFRHSTFYHDYFEDYYEEYVLSKKGKRRKIQRKYIGKYYCSADTLHQWVLRKLLYTALYIVTIGLFIYGMSRDIPTNNKWYIAVPGMLEAVLLLLLLGGMICFLTKRRKMTVYDYKSGSKRLCKLSLFCAIPPVVAAAVTGIVLFISSEVLSSSVISCLICFVGASASAFAIYKLESKNMYATKDSGDCDAGNGVVIK